MYLTIDGETIITTPNHPFYTGGNEWIQASELKASDEVRNANWEIGVVENVKIIAESQFMYNFSVRDAHTYFVGSTQWLVHNDCPLFDKAGVTYSNHFEKRLSQRASRGITESDALETYNSGRVFYNTRDGSYIRYNSRTGTALAVTEPSGGKVITVFEGNVSPA